MNECAKFLHGAAGKTAFAVYLRVVLAENEYEVIGGFYEHYNIVVFEFRAADFGDGKIAIFFESYDGFFQSGEHTFFGNGTVEPILKNQGEKNDGCNEPSEHLFGGDNIDLVSLG